MLQSLVAAGHEIVQGSWTAASILVKYYLAATLVYMAYRKNLSLDTFREHILDNSRVFIYSTGLFGVLLAASGIVLSPVLSVFSQIVALAYLAFLFWVY